MALKLFAYFVCEQSSEESWQGCAVGSVLPPSMTPNACARKGIFSVLDSTWGPKGVCRGTPEKCVLSLGTSSMAPPSACQTCSFSTPRHCQACDKVGLCAHTCFFPLPWKNSDIPDLSAAFIPQPKGRLSATSTYIPGLGQLGLPWWPRASAWG